MLDFHHGFLFQISENAKVDVYAFLFDDMLLLTRFRKLPQKVNKVRRIISDFSFFSLNLADGVIQVTQENEKLTQEEFLQPLQNPLKNLNSCVGKTYLGVPTSICTLDI